MMTRQESEWDHLEVTFNSTYHSITTRSNTTRNVQIQDLSTFPPALIDLLLSHKLSSLSYSTSLGVWNDLQTPLSSLPPAGGWLVVESREEFSKESWAGLLRDTSALLGGAFGGQTFPRCLPFPFHMEKREVIGQFFPTDRASAESLPKWIALLNNHLTASDREMLSRVRFHSCSWYSFGLSISLQEWSNSRSANGLPTQSIELNKFRAYGQAQFLCYHHRSSKEKKVKQEHPWWPNDSLLINRNAYDGLTSSSTFNLSTTIINNYEEPMVLYVTQEFPATIQILHEEAYLTLQGDRQKTNISTDTRHLCPFEERCHYMVEAIVHLSPHSQIDIHWLGRKHLPSIVSLPPDASNGIYISPCRLQGHFTNGSWTKNHFSSPVLLTSPIPDQSMPYTVFTLVSTLLAFFLGSLINIYIKQISPKPPTPHSSDSKETKIEEKDEE
eukprot:scaffold1127_cov186-Ochromonas_danica.AAC.10